MVQPLELSGHRKFVLFSIGNKPKKIQNKLFFLCGPAFTTCPPTGPTIKKKFVASLR